MAELSHRALSQFCQLSAANDAPAVETGLRRTGQREATRVATARARSSRPGRARRTHALHQLLRRASRKRERPRCDCRAHRRSRPAWGRSLTSPRACRRGTRASGAWSCRRTAPARMAVRARARVGCLSAASSHVLGDAVARRLKTGQRKHVVWGVRRPHAVPRREGGGGGGGGGRGGLLLTASECTVLMVSSGMSSAGASSAALAALAAAPSATKRRTHACTHTHTPCVELGIWCSHLCRSRHPQAVQFGTPPHHPVKQALG